MAIHGFYLSIIITSVCRTVEAKVVKPFVTVFVGESYSVSVGSDGDLYRK